MKYSELAIIFLCCVITVNCSLFSKKNKCSIIKYTGSNFAKVNGKQKITVLISNESEDLFKKLNTHAKNCSVVVSVLESFMLESNRSTTEDKSQVNRDALFIGKGIEFELIESNKSSICNKMCLINYDEKRVKIEKVDCFMGGLESIGWKRKTPMNIIADKIYDKNLAEYIKLKKAKETEFASESCNSVYESKYGKKPATKRTTTHKAAKSTKTTKTKTT